MDILFGTGNVNKLKEVREMLSPHADIRIIGLHDIGHLEELEETGDTLIDNAIEKANFLYDKYGCPVFAEDAGLEVDALNGAPGVYSARYAGPGKNARDNMNKLLQALSDSDDRSARFKSVIAYKTHTDIQLFSGAVEGHITRQVNGAGGFGYDPIFQPVGFSQTFGELPSSIKQRISHRAIAWEKLSQTLLIGY